MSLRWITKASNDASLVLVDSQDRPVAEVFEVERDAWHWNVLDVTYGVAVDEETAKGAVYGFIGIRPIR